MWAERERQNFRSPLKRISVTPDPRSVPRSATSRSRSSHFFTPAHRSAPAHQIFGPLQLRSAPAAICFKQQTEKWTDFYRASSYDNAVLAVVIKCVCLSVCLSICRPSVCLSAARVLCHKTKQYTADILMPRERAITLVIWHQQWLVGDAPPSQICAQSDSTLQNAPTSTDFCL